MGRSRSRMAADWFAKLRQNSSTGAIEHDDVTALDTEVTNTVNTAISDIETKVKDDRIILPSNAADFANPEAGAIYFSTDKKSLRGYNGEDWGNIPLSPIGDEFNPAVSGQELSDKPTGTYWIDRGHGAGKFQAHVNNDLQGGGWCLVWNLFSRGTVNSDYRGWNHTDFWTNQAGYEGNVNDPLKDWYKGHSFEGYTNVSEIMIVAHDLGTGAYNNIDGTGGAFGATYIVKSINAANSSRSLWQMMQAGNNNLISNTTVSRSGTVGGNGYSRTSGDVFIDMNYDMYTNVYLTNHVGGGDKNFVRLGTQSRDCNDVNCNGHVVLGGYGGYHDRDGTYGLYWTAEPQIGYHSAPYGYGTSYYNSTGGNTVWDNQTYPSAGAIQYVDFAIYVR